MEKETLEEYISEVTKNFGDEMSIKFTSGGIKLGAKWQAKRMYSEEDMIEFGFSTYCYISELMGVPFNLISENRLNAELWFEQFKKK